MHYILFQLNDKLYLKDPQKSEIGKSIIRHSIQLVDNLGFEQLTFRKIADEMESTEATIYRYFENKLKLLQYLVDWYWASMSFEMNCQLQNIDKPEERLGVCLQLLAGKKTFLHVSPIDLKILQRIAISEGDKAYLTRSIDTDYRDGLLDGFKNVCELLAGIVKQINPKYPFAYSLISTAMITANHQIYFSVHLPLLSDIKNDKKTMNEKLYMFLNNFILNAIKPEA